MRWAPVRCVAIAGWGCALAACAHSDEPSRSTPSRPNAPAPVAQAAPVTPPKTVPLAPKHVGPGPRVALRLGSVSYLDLAEVAKWLNFRTTWSDRNQRVVLANKTNPRNRIEFETDSRKALVDGLAIYLGNAIVLRGKRTYVSERDFWHTLLPLVQPAQLAPPPRPSIIALDAGHGGADNGMENARLGLKEKVLALDVVMRLKRILEGEGYKVVLTRPTDAALSPEKKKDLAMRTDIANRAGAQLFLSVHFNSLYPDTKTSGTEVYVYTPPNQRSSAGLSVGQVDDSKPMQPVNRFDPWSSLFAHQIHRAVLGELGTTDRGQKTMHLAVLQDLNCPAALVESVFLSNDPEARQAATPAYRQRIAESLASAIRDYTAIVDSVRERSVSSAASRRGRKSGGG